MLWMSRHRFRPALSRGAEVRTLSRVRVALDGSDLAQERFEGPSVYAGELLPRLTGMLVERGHTVVTYTPGPLCNVQVAGDVRMVPGAPFWTQRIFAAALRRDRPDALFMPIQMLPVFRPTGMVTVAVIHDLEFLRYPKTYTLTNQLLLRLFTRKAVREATRLIAVSQYTKDEVVRVYGRESADITVVYHGVDAARFHPLPPDVREEERRRVRAQHGLPEQFILFVGALQPRKNVGGLLAAFEELPRLGVPEVGLVLVSGGGWKEEVLLRRIAASPRRRHIRLLRRIPHEALPDLYRAADVFVLPSFSEGFGMPVLEAMACGTPVVTSNASSLPEVAGEAALFAEPGDPADLARTLAHILADREVRQDLIASGFRRAAYFSWERAASETAEVIETAGRGKPNS